MNMLRITCGLLLALGLFAAPATAQRVSLEVGNTAPELDIEEWVRGESMNIEPGRAYIVAFWATWCGPCKRAMPMLSKLQNEYPESDLAVIGISDENVGLVKNFVKKNPTRMQYAVAVDRKESTSKSWMQAAGQNGIPTMFIVDRHEKIQWIGNPLMNPKEFEEIVALVIDDRYDAELRRNAQPMLRAIDAAVKVRNYREAYMYIDKLLETDRRIFALQAARKYAIMAYEEKDTEGAKVYGTELIGNYSQDDALLRRFARKLATDPDIPEEYRDLDLAVAAAAAAAAADDNKPRGFATMALVHFHRDELEQAIALQRRAYLMAEPKQKPDHLRRYRQYMEAGQNQASLQPGGPDL